MTLLIKEIKTLLVEPSSAQFKIISNNLRKFGLVDIVWAQNGKQALEHLGGHEVDLVMSSMHLEDMTGTDLILKIRTGDHARDVPFILVSSETHYRYLEPIRQAGAIAILPKPYERDQLEKALYATLDYYDSEELELDEIALDQVKVLVVDDSETSRRHMSNVLNHIGLDQITQAVNGREGLEMMRAEYYDLIVTDLYMPEMDGKEFVEHIRNNSEQSSVPILMVSSESDESRLAVVRDAGVSAICDKPFEAALVKSMIERMLNSQTR